MGSCCSAPPTWQSSPACLIRPSTCPFPLPHPNFPPNAQRHATFPHILTQVPHLLPASTPPCLIFTPSQSFLSPSISSPSPPLLSSPSYLHSDFLSHSHSQTLPSPVPLSPALSFLWICLLVFRRRESPLLRLPLPSGLAAAASFSRVARALCWSQEGKPGPGFAAKLRTRHFRPNLAFREEGERGGTLALHPRSDLEKSGKWVILLAGPFSSPPEAV